MNATEAASPCLDDRTPAEQGAPRPDAIGVLSAGLDRQCRRWHACRFVFERFTESAREVVRTAQKAARELGHGHVGTEHELLGLLADSDSDASRALNSLRVTADRARERVLEIVPPGDLPDGAIPFTPRAKKVLELSLRESLSLGHRVITPEHVLLGLAHDRDSVAMQVLGGLGADEFAIRAAVLPLLPAPEEAGPQIPPELRPQVEMLPSSAPVVARLLTAASGRALVEGRTQFGIRDLIASAADDEEAASVLASLGVDVDAVRQAIERTDGLEESTN